MNKTRIAQLTAKQRARLLRKQLTVPERKLWELLRNRRFRGEKFRRQYPVGRYIVDFYHAEQKLIIELDGESHAERGLPDEKRQSWLESEGYRVIRFSNDDVLIHEESVLLGILKALGKPIPQ